MSALDEIRARDKRYPHKMEYALPEVQDRRTLLALLDAQSLELQAVREALELARGEYARQTFADDFGNALLVGQVMAAFRELDGHTLFESYDLLRQRVDVLREALAVLKQSRGGK